MHKLILAGMAFAALTSMAQADSIKLGTEGSYPPYNFTDDSGKPAGYDVEVGTELCKRAQLDCTFVTNDWDTIIPGLLARNYDAVIDDVLITDDLKQKVDFTDPYFPPDASRFLSMAGKSFDYANLKGLKIGAQDATVQADYLDDRLKADNTVRKYATQDLAIADLKAGNLDLLLLDGSVADETAAGSSGALQNHGPDLAIGDGAAIAVRKSDADLKAKLNAALGAMKTDGTLDALIGKYFPTRSTPYWN